MLGGIDYNNATVNAKFNVGSTSATVPILITDDTVVDEEDEKFNLILNVLPTTNATVKTDNHSTATVVILDTSMYIHNIMIN